MFALRAYFAAAQPLAFRFRYSGTHGKVFPYMKQTASISVNHNILLCERTEEGKLKEEKQKPFPIISKSDLSNVEQMKEVKKTESDKYSVKDLPYFGVIILGCTIAAVLFYVLMQELLSTKSPNFIYSRALDYCREQSKLIDIFGKPIKGYGELSSRGRRRHVRHTRFIKHGKEHLRLKFYIEGPRNKGTVHLEVSYAENLEFEYVYMIVEIVNHPQKSIVLIDNRSKGEEQEV